MLKEVQIQNLALIEDLSLQFKQGFCALTGETGAGKSILLDGLGLILGQRADTGLVRHGEKRAEVSALFEIHTQPKVLEWLTEQALDDENQCLVRRIVYADGGSKAFINGRPVPASSLKTLGDFLIDIHGQHEHQSLISSLNQLTLVDAYGNHQPQIDQLKNSFKQWQNLTKKYQALKNNQAEHQSKRELAEFQLIEFNKVQPQAEEFNLLSKEQQTLAHAQEIKQAGFASYEALDGDQGATCYINEALHQLEKLATYTPALNNQLNQLNSSLIDIQEVANDIHHYAESVELDPERLDVVEHRLNQLYGLAKKYQLDPEELTVKHQQLEDNLNSLMQEYYSLDELQLKIDQAWLTYEKQALMLRKTRIKSAEALSISVTETMQTLGMQKSEFKIELYSLEKPTLTGLDRIDFLVSANPGQPAKLLSKVASGGELSRISLAIQVACGQIAQIPTLIFDEVDVGIGGGVAEIVGQKMQQLGQHCQTLSITHLGQVAAYGNQHLKVIKLTHEDKTLTEVSELSYSERVNEIARMIGGLEITEQTIKHAEELLIRAQNKT